MMSEGGGIIRKTHVTVSFVIIMHSNSCLNKYPYGPEYIPLMALKINIAEGFGNPQ